MDKLVKVVALLHCVGGSEYYVAAMEGAGNGATELELKSTNITTVPDNENVTVELMDLSYDGDAVLSVKVGIVRGATVSVCIELVVTTVGSSVAYHVQLTSIIVAHTATIDLTLLMPNFTDESTINVLLNTSNENVVVLSHNTTAVLKDILEPNLFVVSEFTRLTLAVTVCLCGAILVLLFTSAAVCVAVGPCCYRRGKRWRISRASVFSPRGDTVSVSTADPNTYELMNRLGENKVTSLLINDDRDFARL